MESTAVARATGPRALPYLRRRPIRGTLLFSRAYARTNDLEDRVAAVVAIATLLWYPPALDPIAEHFLAAHGATF